MDEVAEYICKYHCDLNPDNRPDCKGVQQGRSGRLTGVGFRRAWQE
jgi:hypothetical protein